MPRYLMDRKTACVGRHKLNLMSALMLSARDPLQALELVCITCIQRDADAAGDLILSGEREHIAIPPQDHWRK